MRSEPEAKGGGAAQQGTASAAAEQQTLKLVGSWEGPVDEAVSDALIDALEEPQKDLAIEVTGTVDAAATAAFEKAVAEARDAAIYWSVGAGHP